MPPDECEQAFNFVGGVFLGIFEEKKRNAVEQKTFCSNWGQSPPSQIDRNDRTGRLRVQSTRINIPKDDLLELRLQPDRLITACL
jgi:hypothetical protein